MKILINAQLPDSGSGGVLEVVRSMAYGFKFINNDKLEVHWLLNDSATWWEDLKLDPKKIHFISKKRISKESQDRKSNYNIMKYFKKLFTGIAFILSFFDLRIILLIYKIKPDLIHFPYQQGFFTNKPFIYQVHDMQHKYLKNNFNLIQLFERNFFWKKFSSKASINLCENKSVAKDIQKFFKVKKNKIRIIPIPPNQADFIGKLWTGQKSDYIIYPAAFWTHKNHIRLVEAFALLSKQQSFLKLVFTGFEHKHARLVKQKILELNIEDRVVFKGNLKRVELINQIQNARLVVIPSLFESYSIPVWEAMIMEVPVIASNIRNVSEQLALKDAYFDPLDIDSISEKINEFIFNNKLISESIKLNKKKLIGFNSINYVKQLIILYENTLSIKKQLNTDTFATNFKIYD